jgi:hypothetical protein
MSLAELKAGDSLDGRLFGETEHVVIDGQVVRLTIVLHKAELGPEDEIKKAIDATKD